MVIWKSWHQYPGISIDIGIDLGIYIAIILFLPFELALEKVEH